MSYLSIPLRSQRHADFYFDDGSALFLIDDTLFKVHKTILTSHCCAFDVMFKKREQESTRPVNIFMGGGKRQDVDLEPIHLKDTTVVDFSRFLHVIYKLKDWADVDPMEAWVSVLQQAHKWGSGEVFKLAAEKLHALHIDPVQKVGLWWRYGLAEDQLSDSYRALCTRIEPFTMDETLAMGLAGFTKVAEMRDRLQHAMFSYAKDCIRTGPPATAAITCVVEEDLKASLFEVMAAKQFN